jgi:hypothetical protein
MRLKLRRAGIHQLEDRLRMPMRIAQFPHLLNALVARSFHFIRNPLIAQTHPLELAQLRR